MTFRELLFGCTYKKVFNEIYKNYLKKTKKKSEISELDIRYYDFYNFLKSLPFCKTSIDKIYITNTSGDEPIVDVCFFDKNKDELFSLDFINWKDIIDLEVYKTLQLTDEESLAHILYEITFWAFDEKTLEKQKELLKESIEESESCDKNLWKPEWDWNDEESSN